MNSCDSDSNTSLPTDQSKPSLKKGLQIDRQRTCSLKNMVAIYVLKKVIDYKNPKMLPKFTSQNGMILSFRNTNKSFWKKHIHGKEIKLNIELKESLFLKLDPQNIEVEEPKNIVFEVNIQIHPMLKTPLIPINISKK